MRERDGRLGKLTWAAWLAPNGLGRHKLYTKLIEVHGWTAREIVTGFTVPQLVALWLDEDCLPFAPTRGQFVDAQRRLREKKRRKQQEKSNGR